MRNSLHILTRADDTLARDCIDRLRTLDETEVRVVDLTALDADYDLLLDEILASGNVTVW